MGKTYDKLTRAEILAEMGTTEEMAAVLAAARWVPSQYTEGALTMAGDSDTEDGCYTVQVGGGPVYRHYAGEGYKTGIRVSLRPVPGDDMWPGEPVVAVTASVTRERDIATGPDPRIVAAVRFVTREGGHFGARANLCDLEDEVARHHGLEGMRVTAGEIRAALRECGWKYLDTRGGTDVWERTA